MVRLAADNPMNRALQTLLVFEVVVFGLALPGMVLVDDVPLTPALAAVLAGAVLALAASAGLKRSWGHALGWVVQVVGIAMGLLTAMMYAVGIVFAVIWVTSMVLGRRIETHRHAGSSGTGGVPRQG